MKYAVSAILGSILLAGAANADVYIGVQNGGGPITQVATGASNASWTGSVGLPFEINNISVNNLTDHLNEVSLDVRSTGAGTFDVWATSTDQLGLSVLRSSFTANLLPVGWTVTMRSFLDLANGIFTTPTLIGDALFHTIGTDVDYAPGATTEPYSVTTDITITTPRGHPGTGLSSIQIAAVPEPSSILLMISGLAAFGFWGWRRQVEQSNSATI